MSCIFVNQRNKHVSITSTVIAEGVNSIYHTVAPNYLPQHPESMFLSPCKKTSSTPVHHISQNYVCVYLNLLYFWIENRKTKDSGWNGSRHPQFNVLLISSCKQFLCVSVIPKQLNFAILLKDLLLIFMLWLCPAFCLWDINIQSTSFTQSLTCLLSASSIFTKINWMLQMQAPNYLSTCNSTIGFVCKELTQPLC
jgi:hypothetical protein